MTRSTGEVQPSEGGRLIGVEDVLPNGGERSWATPDLALPEGAHRDAMGDIVLRSGRILTAGAVNPFYVPQARNERGRLGDVDEDGYDTGGRHTKGGLR